MPKKILIIDDDPIVVKYLQAVFSDNGYETVTAGSSMEGLDVVKAVVLVDRQEGGLENIRKHVGDVSGIVTRDELLARWIGSDHPRSFRCRSPS